MMKELMEEYGEIALFLLWGSAIIKLFSEIWKLCIGG